MALYDFIIAGAGASGLALAYQMAASPLRGSSILLVDREIKEQNDRNFTFWTDRPVQLEHLVYRAWDRARVVSDNFQRTYDLRPYQFKMMRGLDYYKGMREALESVPGIMFYQGRVKEMKDAKDKQNAQVLIDTVYHGARYAFDSTYRLADYSRGPARFHYLKQHYKGWEIECAADSFDPSTVTLFDFRTPQKGSFRYFTVAPLSKRRAQVNYTLCSYDLLKPHEYDRAISEYVEGVLRITRYRINSVENAIVPMTDRPMSRRLGTRIMAIGTKGGLVKPSTGCAFLRVHDDARAVVESLINHGHPFHVPRPSGRYRLFDSVMLQLMYRRGDQMTDLYINMFRHNSIQSILRFLDETAGLPENMALIRSLANRTLLKALIQVKLIRKA